jgi:hypothetical protein
MDGRLCGSAAIGSAAAPSSPRLGIAKTDAPDRELISKASKRCEEGGQVDQGGEGASEPLVAQAQPAEPSLEPGEEALHRPLGYPVGGGAKAIGPTTPGPPPPPGVLRYAGPDAPLAQVMAHLPGMVGAVSAQLLWPPPGPAPPTPRPQAPYQLGEGGGIVAVGRAQAHGQGQARRRHQDVHLTPLAPPEAARPYSFPPFLASMVATSTAPSFSRPPR